MAALGWLLNLDFAAGQVVVTAPDAELIEYKAPDQKIHYAARDQKLHYSDKDARTD